MFLRKVTRAMSLLMAVVLVLSVGITAVSAKEKTFKPSATMYTFDEKSHYEISSSAKTTGTAFGTLEISGEMRESGTKGIYKKYIVNTGNFAVEYSFQQSALNRGSTAWHIIEDKTKEVNDITLEENILSGAVIVQSSRDGKLWQTDVTLTNVFTKDSALKDEIFASNDVQLQNGCYYRIIVAYKMEREVESSKVLGFDKKNFEYKKVAEVYEFYAETGEVSKTSSPAQQPRRELGVTVKTEKDTGYTGVLEIDKNDPHFNMDIGVFTINGYTRETSEDNVPVFLKNVGDNVTLWFTLNQDITCLKGDETLSICEDTNGYELHSNPKLSVPQTNLKHGALIVRFTDYEGNAHAPVIYTDFLAANSRTGANTKILLREEGDYEISLIYEIEKDNIQVGSVKTAPSYTNYKINFTFKIRNGNTMVFPFDSVTGRELSDGEMTPNGFRLDLAKSRYLTIDVQREVINVGRDGTLTTDVRFNRPAKDGTIYSDEGIYTVTAHNLYGNGQPTVKTFYVGTNKYMIAMSQQGYTLAELNALIREGATVEADGTITMPPPPTVATEPTVPETEATEPATVATEVTEAATVPEETVPATTAATKATEAPAAAVEVANVEEEAATAGSPVIYGVIAVAVVAVVMVMMKKKKPSNNAEQ